MTHARRPSNAHGPRKAGKTLSIVCFIDALGWDVLRTRQFLEQELPHRKKLRSVFGFSSACVPSILTGRYPQDHLHWSFFYYSPKTSPFKPLRLLRLFPSALINRGRVRHLISKLVKKLYGFTGYFQLYNIPFKHVHLFDYCEKKDLFKPGGMNRGDNIFDRLQAANIRYHVSNWRQGEDANLAALNHDIEQGEIRFAFLYMAAMDALLHQVGKHSPLVDDKFAWYEQKLRQTIQTAEQHYDELRLFICSDHGMASVHTELDLMGQVEQLGLTFKQDYVATYDSTLGRFWTFNDAAREQILALLNRQSLGRVLSKDELASLGCDFPNNQYGEIIFLANPGVMVVPSDMGTNAITGMHGYHPDDIDSDASYISNVPAPDYLEAIPDMFTLMCNEVGLDAKDKPIRPNPRP